MDHTCGRGDRAFGPWRLQLRSAIAPEREKAVGDFHGDRVLAWEARAHRHRRWAHGVQIQRLTENGLWRLNGRSRIRYDPVSFVYPWITLAGAEIELTDLNDSSFAPPLPPSEKKPSVIFMGIGFLLGRRVRIDTVAGRMEFKSSV
mmetsp:Transcript_39645/g.109216  ORF Transcript_39645/g.109216 Transcript_39645/m.109216 type:complete len:146 (+) Transcript_39645:617-1054(+)